MERNLIINSIKYPIQKLINNGFKFKVVLDNVTSININDVGKLYGTTEEGFVVLAFDNIKVTEINASSKYIIVEL